MAFKFACVLGMSSVHGMPDGMDYVLAGHNVYRCMHGVDPLTWDDTIAASAQKWATEGTCNTLQHSGGNYGENIYWASPAPAPSDLYEGVNDWYDEVKYTSGGLTPDWCDSKCGHYTQVVWKSTTAVGCGTCGGTMVCQYDPAGNFDGEFSDNVLATVKSWDECNQKFGLKVAPMSASKMALNVAYPLGIKIRSSMPDGMDSVLNAHNIYRCMHGVQALAWDDTIAASAQKWATEGTCDTLQHSGGNYGENIYWANPAPAPSDLYEGVDDWYAEVKYTSGGLTPDWCDSKCGHYTQVVWKSTTAVGCGTCGGTMVCQYDPAGNFDGEFSDNVLATVKSYDECAQELGVKARLVQV